MTGIGHRRSRQSSSRSGVVHRPTRARSSRTTSGQHVAEGVHLRPGGVALQREPHVAVGEHPHRLEHVAGRQRGRRARRAAGDPEAAAVELEHQGLAVDVQAGEGHQVGESRVGVADHLHVRHLGGDPAAYDVDERVVARVDLVPLGDHRLERRGGGQRGRHVLEAGGALVDPVVAGEGVAPARALADQEHADAGGAAPLVGRAGRRGPPAGQGQAAHRGAGVGEERDVVGQLEGADGPGACRPRGWRSGGRRPPTSGATARSSQVAGVGAPATRRRGPTPPARPTRPRAGPPSARPRSGRRRRRGASPSPGRAARGGRRRCRCW